MTGTQLFEALSFVDEKYIQEAETARLGRNTPWMKVLSVAACLCILITGVHAYGRMQSKGAMESAAEFEAAAPAAPEAAYEEAAPAEAPAAPAATEAAPRQESESLVEDPAAAKEGAGAAAGELQHVPYAQLRIVAQTDDGFAAVVEAVSDEPTPLEAGMEVTIVFDASMVPGNTREVTIDTGRLTENTPVVVEDGAYDAGTNTLYVVEVFLQR